MLTLFHPACAQVRMKGVTSSANAVLHPWLKEHSWTRYDGDATLAISAWYSACVYSHWRLLAQSRPELAEGMAESMQHNLVQRALNGHQPETPAQIMTLPEGVVQGWNLNPTPFEWGGKRAARRQRSRVRRHALGGSGVYAHRPILRNHNLFQKWQEVHQLTPYSPFVNQEVPPCPNSTSPLPPSAT